jgi:hypothetical protein
MAAHTYIPSKLSVHTDKSACVCRYEFVCGCNASTYICKYTFLYNTKCYITHTSVNCVGSLLKLVAAISRFDFLRNQYSRAGARNHGRQSVLVCRTPSYIRAGALHTYVLADIYHYRKSPIEANKIISCIAGNVMGGLRVWMS